MFGIYANPLTVGTKLNKDSKGTKILSYIFNNPECTKYDVVTKVLGRVGTRSQLRGYYCVYFGNLRNGGLIKSNFKGGYTITELGKERLLTALTRG